MKEEGWRGGGVQVQGQIQGSGSSVFGFDAKGGVERYSKLLLYLSLLSPMVLEDGL